MIYEKSSYKYLEFLEHYFTECNGTQLLSQGCPVEKCRFRKSVSIKQLINHLVNDCKKITLECSCCSERMKRPWVAYHDCIDTYEQRLGEAGAKHREEMERQKKELNDAKENLNDVSMTKE